MKCFICCCCFVLLIIFYYFFIFFFGGRDYEGRGQTWEALGNEWDWGVCCEIPKKKSIRKLY